MVATFMWPTLEALLLEAVEPQLPVSRSSTQLAGGWSRISHSRVPLALLWTHMAMSMCLIRATALSTNSTRTSQP